MPCPDTGKPVNALAGGNPPDNHDRALQEAMEWQVSLWSGEVSPEEQQAFTAWLQADPSNQRAWDRVRQLEHLLGQVPEEVAGKALRTKSTDPARRKLLLGLAAFSVAGAGGYGIHLTPQWQAVTADYRTRRGETRNIVLADGTAVTLNTDTAINTGFSGTLREVRLLQGEIMISTAQDPLTQPRPFVVSTRNGRIRPIGTRFSVRQYDDENHHVLVQVLKGAVELSPRSATPMHLNAGEEARFDAYRVSGPHPARPERTAWTRGLIIAEQQRLDEFLEELERYRTGILRCDPAIADLTVSGVYPLNDTDRILYALEEILPVRIHALTRYWITVAPA